MRFFLIVNALRFSYIEVELKKVKAADGSLLDEKETYYFKLDDGDKYVKTTIGADNKPVYTPITTYSAAADIKDGNNKWEQDLEDAQDDLADWYNTAAGERYAQFTSYCSQENVTKYLQWKLYNSLKKDAVAGFTKSVWNGTTDEKRNAVKAAALNLASALRAADDASELDIANTLDDLIRTDVDITGPSANRKLKDTTAEILALKTLAEADPSMKVYVEKSADFEDKAGVSADNDFNGTIKLKYVNKGNNTNYPFHLYIPLYVTYSYQNETPASPKLIFARVQVLSTNNNENEGD